MSLPFLAIRRGGRQTDAGRRTSSLHQQKNKSEGCPGQNHPNHAQRNDPDVTVAR